MSSDSARRLPRRTDSLVHGIAPMTTLPGRVVGAKPAVFTAWLFGLLGADEFDELFPGSGAVTRAWQLYRDQQYRPARAYRPDIAGELPVDCRGRPATRA